MSRKDGGSGRGKRRRGGEAAVKRVRKAPEEKALQVGGIRVKRFYTRPGVDPLDEVKWVRRDCRITNPDGSVVFEMEGAEVPEEWSQLATDIMVSKYFRKAGVPQYDEEGNPILDPDGKPVLGPERSARQVIERIVGCWRYWGERYGYFASEEDAQAFEDEMKYMLVHQIGAPNSPQWFNTGLNWAYGITGPPQGHWYADPDTGEVRLSEDAYTHPQPHACFILSVEDDLVNPGGIMDLWVREARIFKYGSGTGTNFSNIRAEGEPLSGGGKSSGVMSFLRIGDAAAGAIKSGGTTRRAAKMVILDIDHPDILDFIEWKAREEEKARLLIKYGGFPADFNGEAYRTVSGQNSNNSVRVTNAFLQAVEEDREWNTTWRTSGEIARTYRARFLWNKIAEAAWRCADPGLQFDDTINQWHTCPNSGRIRASNPCSEYMFLDNTACNLASLNLLKFLDQETGRFNLDAYRHAIRLWTIVLEISVLMAQFPAREIAERSYQFRTLGLGYANLGSVLMRLGIPYDSEQGRAICAALTAILTGEAYATSAELAKVLGPFPKFEENREEMLRVIRNHRRAAYNSPPEEYEGLTITPVGIDPHHCPDYLLEAARKAWDRALEMGEEWGYRNAQVSVLAPTGTIGLLMDCDTTGIEPDFALVKFKKLAGGGYFKIVNQSVAPALRALGYEEEQIKDILDYIRGRGSLKGAPFINHQTLRERGFGDEELEAIERALPNALELRHVFTPWILGEEFLTQQLGFTKEQIFSPDFNLLKELGFNQSQIEAAEEYACGTQTIEGAPHLREEHLPVFDCANRCGKRGRRYLSPMSHVKMMAAAQPFISGAISKTVNLPKEATVEDIKKIYYQSWKLGLKAIAIYRDASKASQILYAGKEEQEEEEEPKEVEAREEKEKAAAPAPASQAEPAPAPTAPPAPGQQVITDTPGRPIRRKLPAKRFGFTQEARIGNTKIYIRTGQYEDGTLGEIFIDMFKEGTTVRSLLNCFAVAVSKALQYGVPLEEFVDSFTFTRFEPAGIVQGHPYIKRCNSILDFVFRVLAIEYLGRDDLAHVPPEDTDQLQLNLVMVPKNGLKEHKGENGNGGGEGSVEPSGSGGIATPESTPEPVGQGEPVAAGRASSAAQEKKAPRKPVVEVGETPLPQAELDQQLAQLMGDAPPCEVCGHLTVRNATCYRCLNCGHSMGCS